MRIGLTSGTPAEFVEVPGATTGIVSIPGIFGLRPLYDDMAEHFATDWGTSTIAVEPFPGFDFDDAELEPRFAAVPRLDDTLLIRDLELAADVTGCDRVGLIGFCMGGMYCFKAASSDRFHRIASFYGMIRLPDDWRSDGHAEPLDLLDAGHADRVLAIIGDRDHYTPPDDVAALGAAGVRVVRYPEAEHGFAHAPERPSHRPDDAADAFGLARDWLREAL